ncbi:MAG: DUF1761 domain-containing protein [Chlamydiales bacterium]|nr:DUF1761 domain-containing protein [Chlamydiales bacterium]
MPTLFMDVNFWAVFTAAVVYMVIGGIWYSPFLFGKLWLAESKIKRDEMSGQGTALAASFLAAIVLGYVLGYFIAATHSGTFFYGAYIAFWAWLGFVATTKILDILYLGKSWKLVVIDGGYLLIAYLAMGAVLGGF